MKQIPSKPTAPAFARVLAFGRMKTGKTTFATSWPAPLIIDADHSTGMLFKTNPDVLTLTTRSYRDVLESLDEMASKGTLPKTVVIDGMNLFYTAICDSHPEDTYKTEINREFREFVEHLFNYRAHLVITCSEKEIFAQPGDKLPQGPDAEPYIVKPTDSIGVGYRPEMPQVVEHLADFVFRMTGDDASGRTAFVAGQRGNALPQLAYPNLTASVILDAMKPSAPPIPTTDALIHLGKKLTDLLPKGTTKIKGLVGYAKSKNIPYNPKSPTPESLTALHDALVADIATCEQRATIRAVATPPSEAPATTTPPPPQVTDSAKTATTATKYGPPRHQRLAAK